MSLKDNSIRLKKIEVKVKKLLLARGHHIKEEEDNEKLEVTHRNVWERFRLHVNLQTPVDKRVEQTLHASTDQQGRFNRLQALAAFPRPGFQKNGYHFDWAPQNVQTAIFRSLTNCEKIVSWKSGNATYYSLGKAYKTLERQLQVIQDRKKEKQEKQEKGSTLTDLEVWEKKKYTTVQSVFKHVILKSTEGDALQFYKLEVMKGVRLLFLSQSDTTGEPPWLDDSWQDDTRWVHDFFHRMKRDIELFRSSKWWEMSGKKSPEEFPRRFQEYGDVSFYPLSQEEKTGPFWGSFETEWFDRGKERESINEIIRREWKEANDREESWDIMKSDERVRDFAQRFFESNFKEDIKTFNDIKTKYKIIEGFLKEGMGREEELELFNKTTVLDENFNVVEGVTNIYKAYLFETEKVDAKTLTETVDAKTLKKSANAESRRLRRGRNVKVKLFALKAERQPPESVMLLTTPDLFAEEQKKDPLVLPEYCILAETFFSPKWETACRHSDFDIYDTPKELVDPFDWDATNSTRDPIALSFDDPEKVDVIDLEEEDALEDDVRWGAPSDCRRGHAFDDFPDIHPTADQGIINDKYMCFCPNPHKMRGGEPVAAQLEGEFFTSYQAYCWTKELRKWYTNRTEEQWNAVITHQNFDQIDPKWASDMLNVHSLDEKWWLKPEAGALPVIKVPLGYRPVWTGRVLSLDLEPFDPLWDPVVLPNDKEHPITFKDALDKALETEFKTALKARESDTIFNVIEETLRKKISSEETKLSIMENLTKELKLSDSGDKDKIPRQLQQLQRRIESILEHYEIEIFQTDGQERKKRYKKKTIESVRNIAKHALEKLMEVQAETLDDAAPTEKAKWEKRWKEVVEKRIQALYDAANIGEDVRHFNDFGIYSTTGVAGRAEIAKLAHKLLSNKAKIYGHIAANKYINNSLDLAAEATEETLPEVQWGLKRKESSSHFFKQRPILRQEKLVWMQCLLKGEDTPIKLCEKCTRPFIFIEGAEHSEFCIMCANKYKASDKEILRTDKSNPEQAAIAVGSRLKKGWEGAYKAMFTADKKRTQTAASYSSTKGVKKRTQTAAASSSSTKGGKKGGKKRGKKRDKPSVVETFSFAGIPDNRQHDTLEFLRVVLDKMDKFSLIEGYAVGWPVEDKVEESGGKKYTGDLSSLDAVNPNQFLLVNRQYKEGGDQTRLPLQITHPSLTQNVLWQLTNITLHSNKSTFEEVQPQQGGHYTSWVRTAENVWQFFSNDGGTGTSETKTRNNLVADQDMLKKAYIMLYTPNITYTAPQKVTGLGASVTQNGNVPSHKNTCYAAAGVHLLRGMGLIQLQDEETSDYSYWKTYIGDSNS